MNLSADLVFARHYLCNVFFCLLVCSCLLRCPLFGRGEEEVTKVEAITAAEPDDSESVEDSDAEVIITTLMLVRTSGASEKKSGQEYECENEEQEIQTGWERRKMSLWR